MSKPSVQDDLKYKNTEKNTIHKVFYRQQDGSEFYDVSSLVTTITLTSAEGSFASAGLEISDAKLVPNGVSLEDDKREEELVVTENDLIYVIETTEKHLGVPTLPGKGEGRVVMQGIVVSFGLSYSSKSRTIKILVQPPVSWLDTVTCFDIISTRSTLAHSDALLSPSKQTVYDEVTALHKDRGGGKWVVSKYPVLYNKVSGLNDNLYILDAKKSRMKVYVWNLVRELMFDVISVYTKKEVSESVLKELKVTASDYYPLIEEKIARVGLEMSHISCEGSYLDITTDEFGGLLKEIIQAFAYSSGRTSTVWGILRKIMSVYFYDFSTELFTPITDVSKMLCAGRFLLKDPYKPHRAVIPYPLIDRAIMKIPPSTQLISSVSLEVEQKLNSIDYLGRDDENKDFQTSALYYPKGGGDYIIAKDNYKYPLLARNYEVPTPTWINNTVAFNQRRSRDSAVDASLDHPYREEDSIMSPSESLEMTAQTLGRYLATAWQWYGRKACEVTLSILSTVPSFVPGVVLKVEFEEGVYYTGYVKTVNMTWRQSGSYDIVVNMSHWTCEGDPYYGGVKNTLYA